MSVVSVVCCQVGVSATGRSLAQKSPAECGVPECGLETSALRKPRPTGGGCRVMKSKTLYVFLLSNRHISLICDKSVTTQNVLFCRRDF